MNCPQSQGSEKSEVALKDSLGMLFSSTHMIAVFAQGEIKLEDQFDLGGLIYNICFGVAVAAIAATVVTLDAGAPFSAIFAAGVIGGMVGVGCLAKSDFSNYSDNKLFREIRKYINSNKVERYISNVAKACGYKGTLATRAEALAWARENARSMIMSLGGKSTLMVTVRTLGIEIPTSGLLSDFVSGVFLKENENTENSLKIVQKYIEQYGY